MEELIDVFLDELIDKKEITQNERTDMKLTLLEAMPNGMNDETKTRVMSALKSKMDTPSANIFTDKGVNIEAVRTIATETVKNVVETVEKETSVREEAEAKRAAQIDDALNQTIAEADRIEVSNQLQNEKDIDAYNESYDKMKSLWGNKYSEEQIAFFAQIDAESKKINESAQRLSENEGLSPDEAYRKSLETAANGDPNKVKALHVSNDANASEDVLKYIGSEIIENGLTFYEAAEKAKIKFAEIYFGIDLDMLITEAHDQLMLKKGYTESFFRGETTSILDSDENGKFIYDSKIEDDLIIRLRLGDSFEKAVEQIRKDYKIFMPLIKDFDGLIDKVRKKFLSFGLKEEELESDRISLEVLNAVQANSSKEKNDDEIESQGPMPLMADQLDSSKEVRSDSEPKKNVGVASATYKHNSKTGNDLIDDFFSIIINPKRLEQQEKLLELQGKQQGIYVKHYNERTVKTSNLASIDIANYNLKVGHYKKIRDIDKEDAENGNLTEERKSLIIQRERHLKKAVEVFLTGEKSAYEIIYSFGDLAERYELYAADIIEAATNRMKNTNPELVDQITKNEKTIVENYLKLDSAEITLKNARDKNDDKSEERIKKEIQELRNEIRALRDSSISVKEKYGSFDVDKSIALEKDMNKTLLATTKFNDQQKDLKTMQSVYSKIQELAKRKDASFNKAARHYFTRMISTAQKFGPELMEAIGYNRTNEQEGEEYDLKRIVEKAIRNQNKDYIATIESNISMIDKETKEMEKTAVNDVGYTDALVEKDRLERELKKAEERDNILDPQSSVLSKNVKRHGKVINLRKAVLQYYTKGYNAADMYSFLKEQGANIDISELLKGIASVAKMAGMQEDQIKKLVAVEMNTYQDYIRLEGLNKLKENAERYSKNGALIGLNYQSDKLKAEIEERNKTIEEFKGVVKKEIPDLGKALGIVASKNKNELKGKVVRGLKTASTGVHVVNTEEEKHSLSTKPIESEQQSISATTKNGVGIMNVAKVLESNNTTSQEIVGVTTELGRVVRVQDDRGVDSTEQRDS